MKHTELSESPCTDGRPGSSARKELLHITVALELPSIRLFDPRIFFAFTGRLHGHKKCGSAVLDRVLCSYMIDLMKCHGDFFAFHVTCRCASERAQLISLIVVSYSAACLSGRVAAFAGTDVPLAKIGEGGELC